jgi:hypothetical protein
MFDRIGINRRLVAALGAAACCSIGLLDAANAGAQNLATCRFETHVALSGGAFSSDGPSSADCTGMVAGTVSGSGGTYTVAGRYSGDTCTLTSWRGTFEAQVPQVLYFFDPQYAVFDGNLQIMQTGQALAVSGDGIVAGEHVSYAGTGGFRPDGGQACSATGGTLTEQVVLMDGGSVSASQTASPSGSAARHHQSHHHRHYGRRHHSRRSA